jgi:hypothetical protein
MKTTTSEFTNTDATRFDFVRRVNAGEVTTVAGREVYARFGARATAWQNGSVSVEVRGRHARQGNPVWVREGQTVTFETETV